MNNKEIIFSGLKKFDVFIDENKYILFEKYISEILRWNKSINITAIEDEKEIIIKHFFDSISSSLMIDYNNHKILDIGTGVGFPGLPLKIVFNDMMISFLDSSRKKTKVLEKICNSLNIKNYEIINTNIEIAGKDLNYREKFDFVVCRALSEMNVIIEYGIPFLKINGKLVIYKGPNCQKEVENSDNALNKLNAKIYKNIDIILPFSDYKRKIIIVEKIGKTPDFFPRNVGIPKKRPL